MTDQKKDPRLDASPNCQSDNWGMPNQKERPFSDKYETSILNKCKTQFIENSKNMADALDTATLSYYKKTEDFSNFVATDFVPENKNLFKPSAPWGKRFIDGERGVVKAAFCHLEDEDGGTWEIHRIGPFKSHGGYDWWQIGWNDLFNLEAAIKSYPDGVYITDQFSSPILSNGTRLGHPPIHVHHVHIGPMPAVRQRCETLNCIIHHDHCYDPTRVMEHHGDFQCLDSSPEEGGLNCMWEKFANGYGKLITHPIGLEADFNDVRPPESEELEWYWQLGAKWYPKLSAENVNTVKNPKTAEVSRNLKAMSFHNFNGPGNFNILNQLSYILTFQAPTDRETVYWYTGRLAHKGTLLRNKIHAHNTLFDEAIFFAATPEQLGLTQANKLLPLKPFIPIDIKKAGYKDSKDLKAFILSNLKQAAEEYRKTLESSASGDGDTAANLRGDKTSKDLVTEPKVICQAYGRVQEVHGYYYDRRQPTCCVPWDFEQGEVFTVVGFNDHLGMSPGPHYPKGYIPPTLPGHIGWWLSYDTKESPEQSHFSFSSYNQNPDGGLTSVKDIGSIQATSMVIYGGTIPDFNSYSGVPHLAESVFIYSSARYPFAALIIFVAISLWIFRCCSRRVSKETVASSKASSQIELKEEKERFQRKDAHSSSSTVMDSISKFEQTALLLGPNAQQEAL